MKVLDDEEHSQVYMVMEWVEGRLLRNLMVELGKLPPNARCASRSAFARRSIISTSTASCIAT